MQQRSKSRFICDWLSATAGLHKLIDPQRDTFAAPCNGLRVISKKQPAVRFVLAAGSDMVL